MGVRQRSTLTVDLVGDGDRGKARVGEPVVLSFSKPEQHGHHHQQQHHRRIAYLRWATGFRSVFSWTAAHCCSCLLPQSPNGPSDRGDALRHLEGSIPVPGDHKVQKIPQLMEGPGDSEEPVQPARDDFSDREVQALEKDGGLLTLDDLEDYVPGDGETFGRETIGRDGTSQEETQWRRDNDHDDDDDDDVEISVIQTTLKPPPHRHHYQQQQHHYYNSHHYGHYRDVFYRRGVVTSTASFVLEGGQMKSALVPRASLLGARVFTSRADLFVSSGTGGGVGQARSVVEARGGETNIGSRPWVCVSV
ncbi:unnamed protein product [Lampetra fluviatilis]